MMVNALIGRFPPSSLPPKVWAECTVVLMADLSVRDLEDYVATREPLDKAGGYGIQGRAGAFVRRIEGSYSGIMGLPLFETAQLLRQAGVKF